MSINRRSEPREMEPIRDKADLESWKRELAKQSDRDYMLGMLLLNTGMRLTEALQLRVRDVRGREKVRIRANQELVYPLHGAIRKLLAAYTSNMDQDEWLFSSRKGEGPLQRDQASKLLKGCAKRAGISSFGVHSLRKTFGYHYYKASKDVEFLRKLFRQSSQSVTLSYIGVIGEGADSLDDTFSL
ncbi:tyrosine-type recombinase/integrase [Alkalicoccus luteus]|uniref:Tyrosine-type recombinase/integrase n=1 Tax=Alkalicoccus luteus TaxID=1237094 RepID=A0A969TUF4_9BACI|nr:tyrosine-type recombinase/integrase [Alkalicoccus luteus]NJP37285.1 tyrosine-type recombinase/integrase [Alkalicoccus luteus]